MKKSKEGNFKCIKGVLEKCNNCGGVIDNEGIPDEIREDLPFTWCNCKEDNKKSKKSDDMASHCDKKQKDNEVVIIITVTPEDVSTKIKVGKDSTTNASIIGALEIAKNNLLKKCT